MSIDRRIAFIGAGNMAGALIDGLLKAGASKPEELFAVDVRADRLEELSTLHPGLRTGREVEALLFAEVIVLSVKPQVLDSVLSVVRNDVTKSHLVVSVVAGKSLALIEAELPRGARVVRAMPNTPALVRAGATAIAGGPAATDEDLTLARRIFEAVGETIVLDEELLDAVTGLSGSGPAYVFLMIDALADGGVKVGLDRQSSLFLAAHTLAGAARLLLETGEHPGRLKDRVTSPGGTAIAGLHVLESGGLRTTLINAVERATERARELGQGEGETSLPHGRDRR